MTTTDTLSVPDPVSAPDTGTPRPIADSRALSMVSLLVSAAAIVTGVGVLGVGGIVAGFVARRDEPGHRTLSTWGIVLGFVAVFGWVLLALVGVAVALPVWIANGGR